MSYDQNKQSQPSMGAIKRTLDKINLGAFLIITTALTYLLMVIGSHTSSIGAGLACPDWPTCYGVLVPFIHPDVIAESPYTATEIFFEWFHRTLAAIVGPLILIGIATAYTQRWRGAPLYSLGVATLLLPVQVTLGMLTVSSKLEPVIGTAHLATATLILVSLTIATVIIWRERNDER